MKNEFNPAAVIKALQNVLPPGGNVIALHEPYFHGSEYSYIKECLDSGWISSSGKYVDSLESQLSEYTGTSYALSKFIHTPKPTAGLFRRYHVRNLNK